jgi:flagellar protein FlaJ
MAFLFIIPEAIAERLSFRLLGLGNKIGSFIPGLSYDLSVATNYSTGGWIARALMNTLVYGLGIFLLVAYVLYARGTVDLSLSTAALVALAPAIGAGVLTSVALFAFLLFYPRVLAGKLAETVDKDLIFALKDLQLQIVSGVTLFNALNNVANAGYGSVSKEIDFVVKDVNAGTAIDAALEKMSNRTKSEFMRRVIWQLVTALRGGASLEGALKTLVEILKREQASRIRGFVSELNLWALMFMIFAVAVPGLGSTLLIIISAFGGIQVSEMTYVMALAGCFVVEILIIGFIKSRRPIVHLR